MQRQKQYPLQTIRQAWGAGRASANKESAGEEWSFFHTFNEEGLHWQGRIIKSLPNGKVVIQLYSWITGWPTDEICVTPEENWVFYKTRQEWIDAGSDSPLYHRQAGAN